MTFTSTLRLIALATACMMTMSAQLPAGWFLAGNRPADYASGIEPEALHDGLPVLFIKSRPDRQLYGFGTIMKELGAEDYLGQQVRFTLLSNRGV